MLLNATKVFGLLTNLKNTVLSSVTSRTSSILDKTSQSKLQIILGRSFWNRLINGNLISRNRSHGRPRRRCVDKIETNVGQKYLKMQLHLHLLRTALTDETS